MTRTLALLALLALASAGCAKPATEPPPPAAPADVVVLDATAQAHAGIEVAEAVTDMRAEQTEAPGVLVLDERRTARIGSLVEGIVLAAFAEVGDRVRGGQVLAHLHSPVVHDAWADYRKGIAERRRLENQLAFAVAAFERTQRLHADKAVSLQELQRAEAERTSAEELLDMGRTEVRRAEEELEHLGITNADDPSGESGEQIPVRAPGAGVVLERLVTPGTAVTPGTPLFVVSDLSALWALVEIDEALLSHVHVGQAMTLRVAAYPDETFAGTVALVGDMVNPRTRRVTVRCAMPNLDGRLKPQMYATALIQETAARSMVVVPAAAIQAIDGRQVLFVAETPDRFRPRRVETGATRDGAIEIRSGLAAGERIAVAGSFVLKSMLIALAAPEG